MTAWWKNPDALSSGQLYAKMRECEVRANEHEDQDRPNFAHAARTKQQIAADALKRKGMAA